MTTTRKVFASGALAKMSVWQTFDSLIPAVVPFGIYQSVHLGVWLLAQPASTQMAMPATIFLAIMARSFELWRWQPFGVRIAYCLPSCRRSCLSDVATTETGKRTVGCGMGAKDAVN